ncbi:hypothetical protein EZMO1_0838 [Endozoicomonas montiporae CL-33]|uniref:Uncharacterized protein n=1 Tax=Endozoicomonas montiporae CL-33 TaxID=570277 RepID=A0A142B8I5_9GAMM|nr:hypothetical protein EZMO1_0838 [Endozoicomonas montiporae CL-33]
MAEDLNYDGAIGTVTGSIIYIDKVSCDGHAIVAFR